MNPHLTRHIFRLIQIATVAAAWTWSAPTVDAQTVRQEFPSTDKPVRAAVVSGGTLYIGGNFTVVGKETGGWASFSAVNGALATNSPQVAGKVYAAAPDGVGGWYIGGSSTAVGGISRSNLAHILADNGVGSWNPGASGSVFTLAVSDSAVYAGGFFASIGERAVRSGGAPGGVSRKRAANGGVSLPLVCWPGGGHEKARAAPIRAFVLPLSAVEERL